MVTVLGGLAEFERELIVARTSEGRARAKARGVKLGPRFKLSAEQRAYVARERAKGEGVRHLARILGVSKATIGTHSARRAVTFTLRPVWRALAHKPRGDPATNRSSSPPAAGRCSPASRRACPRGRCPTSTPSS